MAQITIEAVNVTNTYSNTNISILAITEDKLINILTRHVGKLKKSKEWWAALSFSISLLLVLLTSDFHSFLGLLGEQWQMLFILLLIASIAYMIYAIYNCCKHNVTVEIIVKEIKDVQQPRVQTES